MAEGTALAEALTAEHRGIDAGIEAYKADPDAGAQPLRDAMAALRRHIYLEETFLFPPLKQGGMMMALMVMERQHGELWHQMDGLDTALDDGTSTADLREQCDAMLALLDSHNTKEEPIVYPRADSDLTADVQKTLGDFLQSGALPDGWVCAKA